MQSGLASAQTRASRSSISRMTIGNCDPCCNPVESPGPCAGLIRRRPRLGRRRPAPDVADEYRLFAVDRLHRAAFYGGSPKRLGCSENASGRRLNRRLGMTAETNVGPAPRLNRSMWFSAANRAALTTPMRDCAHPGRAFGQKLGQPRSGAQTLIPAASVGSFCRTVCAGLCFTGGKAVHMFLDTETICSLVLKVRRLHGSEIAEPDGADGSNDADDGMDDVLVDGLDDGNVAEIKGVIDALDSDECEELIGLLLLGGHPEDYEDIEQAKAAAQDFPSGILEYFLENEAAAEYLVGGLEAVGVDCGPINQGAAPVSGARAARRT